MLYKFLFFIGTALALWIIAKSRLIGVAEKAFSLSLPYLRARSRNTCDRSSACGVIDFSAYLFGFTIIVAYPRILEYTIDSARFAFFD